MDAMTNIYGVELGSNWVLLGPQHWVRVELPLDCAKPRKWVRDANPQPEPETRVGAIQAD